MAPGDYETKAVPTYVAAEAETTPLPKITVSATPPGSSSRGRGIGDLPMRVVYQVLVGVTVVAVAGTVAAVAVLDDGEPATRTAVSVPRATIVTGGPMPSQSPAASASAASSPSPDVTASPVPSADMSALEAALADPRLPALPTSDQKLRRLPGHPASTRGPLKDKRSGVAFPRFAKPWELATAKPFASRQVLPMVKGSGGMLVSCPVPILPQRSLRDTALLVARWTLNHHPSGATVTWTASQSVKVGKREGWLLGYRVHYTIKNKKRTSMAAVLLVDVPVKKPAVVFITIPDSQKRRWPDISRVMSSVKVL